MSHSTISFIVLGATVVGFVSNRIAPEIVAIAAALVLYAAGVLKPDQAIAGFGDPTVVFIASLFVVSEGLDAAAVTTWVGQRLLGRAGSSGSRLLVLLLGLIAALSAVITPNGAVAALMPVGVVVALALRSSPSRLLMPLAFAASAGSLLALTGSPVNVLVSEAAANSAGHGFGFFSFALVGVPLALGTIAISVLLAPRLVPQRSAQTIARDLSRHARALDDQYELDPDVLARHDVPTRLLTRDSGVAEVVIPPRSELVGDRVFPGMVTDSGDLIVLAVQRRGEDVEREAELEVGDTLLLQGTWSALDENLVPDEVLVVDSPEQIRRQAVPLGPGARPAIAVLVAMITLLASGAVPAFVATLLAACAMVVSRVITVDQAYRAVSWTTVILIGAMFAVSTAIKDSGAAEKIAHALVAAIGGAGPYALLAALALLTVAFGQLISNTATALIVIPIALSAAHQLSVSTRPVLMSVAVAAAASFLTPIATPVNMMVMGPAGYRFGDYWKLGLCLIVLFLLGAVLLVPVWWSF